ncbi:hypothetical protein ACFVMC_13890 [Nocardia sp. NPDC127579]|uniref:hypothetical protein n=1 Tax=Nocardia sp. NPDC127579 TaxID=3345402 RepID=UPI00363628AF
MSERRIPLLVAGLAVVAAAMAGYVFAGQNDGPGNPQSSERHAEVAAKGQQVMPFDLNRTTHQFTKSATGGVQSVTADDPADTEQITLIRGHLTEAAAGFGHGDYGDPAAIHGTGMPGLRELQQGHTRIEIRYAETPAGAQITYTSSDPSLVTALHTWFDAQVSDHGSHAEHG